MPRRSTLGLSHQRLYVKLRKYGLTPTEGAWRTPWIVGGVTLPGQIQDADCRSDMRREQLVGLCHHVDVQKPTFEAYMNKKLVKARPLAHIETGLWNMLHLTGLVRPEHV